MTSAEPVDLDALAAMETQASPTPWENWESQIYSNGSDCVAVIPILNDRQHVDADFVTALRNAAPWLLARARRAAELEAVLSTINDIRNSIIGFQTVNFSEHVYPLVAALKRAGIEGTGYPQAREQFGTMLERTKTAKAKIAALEAENAELRRELAETQDDADGG